MAKFALVFWSRKTNILLYQLKWITEPKAEIISSASLPTEGRSKFGQASKTYPIDILDLSGKSFLAAASYVKQCLKPL